MCHRPEPDYSRNTYLGIHLGNELMDAIILNADMEMLFTAVIRYDIDLPEYKTTAGVNKCDEAHVFVVNPVMYVKALDMLINCLASQGADLHMVAAIGGAAHNHGAIYWSLPGFRALCGLNPTMRLHQQITEKSFTIPSFHWKGDSIDRHCFAMEDLISKVSDIQTITGSKCYVRMTGPEIRKVYKDHPEEYAKTVRISRNSSFLASLLIGTIASIEHSDGSLMNLLNIKLKTWSRACVTSCAPDLAKRLMQPIPSNRLQGHICDYYVKRWNFRPDCMIVSATGTCPSMLCSVRENECFLMLSMSTNDVIIMPSKELLALDEAVILCHPTLDNEYMGLLYFRNGGRVRQRICNEVANGDWALFTEMLEDTPMGNEGNLAIHFDELEYIPEALGSLRWDNDIDDLSVEAQHGREKFSEPRFEARAVIEGQLMHRRANMIGSGMNFCPGMKIIATGTCIKHDSFLQIVADVFNTSVYRQNIPIQASVMGAAYRARYAFYQYREVNCNCRKCKIRRGRQPQLSYGEFMQRLPDNLELIATPTPGCEEIYAPLIERCIKMSRILKLSNRNVEVSTVRYELKDGLRPI